ncbi:hypothetical protein KAT08_03735 [Candidatus Babeliales bacterium]|nr:hypothetical protein [Candidatus Babeliales bacterium]
MKPRNIFSVLISITIIIIFLLTCGCVKKSQLSFEKKSEIDFCVKNSTGHTIYITCFSYIKKQLLLDTQSFAQWRWDKSNIYELKNNQTIQIDIDTIKDKQNRKNVYGALGIFENRKDAEDSTYALLNNKHKIDLDQLYKLKNKMVIIQIEKYGFKGKSLDFDIIPKKLLKIKHPELDFIVENKTGKTIYLCCFIYQIKEETSIWKYDKTPIKKLKPGKHALIDADTIIKDYNRKYARGTLAIFEENEQALAEKITFELLNPSNKIDIGRLAAIKNKKIVLEIEQYGTKGDLIDFSIQPIQKDKIIF